MRRATIRFAVGAMLGLAASDARANGRFPTAQNLFAGPGASAQVLALEATIGMAWSRDSGATWQYICEPALGYPPTTTYDFVPYVASDGSVIVTLPGGLTRSDATSCSFSRPSTAPTDDVVDIAGDPLGTTIAAAYSPLSNPDYVTVSHDSGQTWQTGWIAPTGTFIATIEVAPANPNRMYLSTETTSATLAILRSDDGGMTFTATGADLMGAYQSFVSAVDSHDPDVVYVRANLPTGGTMLLRSTDGAASFSLIGQTASPMLGFALSPDDGTLWISGSGACEGITRSSDIGAHWTPLDNSFVAVCLRYASGLLFACGDYATDGFALAYSSDLGSHFIPLLTFANLPGSDGCPAGTDVNTQCQATYSLVVDGGITPVPVEHFDDEDIAFLPTSTCGTDADRVDAIEPGMDAATDAPGSEPPQHASGCGCRAAASTHEPGMVAIVVVGVTLLRRRRKRATATSALSLR